MRKKVLDAKALKNALKQPFGITMIMNKHGFITLEDLLSYIDDMSTNSSSFVRDVTKKFNAEEKNKKKAKRHTGRNEGVSTSNVEKTHDESQDSVTKNVFEEPQESISNAVTETLEELIQLESILSEKVAVSEVACQKFYSEKKELLTKIEIVKQKLEALFGELNILEDSFSNLYNELKTCEKEIKEHTAKKTELSSELQAVRTKIEELKRVTIFVYADGGIEVENAEIPEIPDIPAEKIVELFSIPEVGKLMVDELKSIARLQEIVKHYQKYDIDIEFENENVQKLWEVLTH